MDPKTEEKRIRMTLWIVGVAILLIAGAWGWWMLPAGWPPGRDMPNRGAWGDSFAPLAILVNGAAIILALWSVTLQRLELRAALQEMKTQSEHLATAAGEQRLANERQREANDLQREANRLAAQADVTAQAAIVMQRAALVAQIEAEIQKAVADTEFHQAEPGSARDVRRAQAIAERLSRVVKDYGVVTRGLVGHDTD